MSDVKFRVVSTESKNNNEAAIYMVVPENMNPKHIAVFNLFPNKHGDIIANSFPLAKEDNLLPFKDALQTIVAKRKQHILYSAAAVSTATNGGDDDGTNEEVPIVSNKKLKVEPKVEAKKKSAAIADDNDDNDQEMTPVKPSKVVAVAPPPPSSKNKVKFDMNNDDNDNDTEMSVPAAAAAPAPAPVVAPVVPTKKTGLVAPTPPPTAVKKPIPPPTAALSTDDNMEDDIPDITPVKKEKEKEKPKKADKWSVHLYGRVLQYPDLTIEANTKYQTDHEAADDNVLLTNYEKCVNNFIKGHEIINKCKTEIQKQTKLKQEEEESESPDKEAIIRMDDDIKLRTIKIADTEHRLQILQAKIPIMHRIAKERGLQPYEPKEEPSDSSAATAATAATVAATPVATPAASYVAPPRKQAAIAPPPPPPSVKAEKVEKAVSENKCKYCDNERDTTKPDVAVCTDCSKHMRACHYTDENNVKCTNKLHLLYDKDKYFMSPTRLPAKRWKGVLIEKHHKNIEKYACATHSTDKKLLLQHYDMIDNKWVCSECDKETADKEIEA
jgi:hypothetical protein